MSRKLLHRTPNPEAARKRQRGQIVILSALLLPVMCGFAGLAIDGGYLYGRQQAAQAAADASAQAAATALAHGATMAKAVSDADAYAAMNGFTNQNSTIQVNDPPLSPPSAGHYSSSYVQVVISVHTNALLSRVVGVTGLSATAQAVAGWAPASSLPCTLCVLDSSASGALSMNGNGSLTVSGITAVDSSSASAVQLTGNVAVSSTTFNVTGGVSRTGSVSVGPITTGATTIPDPLATFPQMTDVLPTFGSVSPSSGSSMVPGVYSSVSLSGSGTLTLEPGVYVFTGNFDIHGNWTIAGAGVTLYFACPEYPTACSPQEVGAGLIMHGTSNLELSAPTTGPDQGMLIFYDRHNAASLSLYGTSSTSLSGTIYARSAAMDLHGTDRGIDSMTVVNTLSISGTPSLTIAATPQNNVPLPTSVLVE